MNKSVLFNKVIRVLTGSAVLGTAAALILVGAPADAGMIGTAARGVSITFARGV